MPGGIGERAAVGPAGPGQPGDPAVELVAGEHAAGDQVPGLCGHPLVVVADAGQAVRRGAVAGDPHRRGAVLQAVQLVQGGERGARVGRLVAEHPVQLGGVADRLMDDQPQVGRVDDQVVTPRGDGRGGHLGRQQAGQLGQFGVEVPAGAGQVLIAAARGRGQRAHGLEPAARLDRDRGQRRVQPDPLLGGGGDAVRVELVLPHLDQGRVHVVDPRAGQQAGAPLAEQCQLVGHRHAEGVHVVGGHPGHVAVAGLVGQLDALGVHRRGHRGHVHGFFGRAHRRLGGHIDGGREPPGPVAHDPDGQAQLVGVQQGLQVPVRQADVLAADQLGAEVGVLGAQLAGPLQGSRGQLAQRVPGELRIDRMSTVLHEWQPIPPWPGTLTGAARPAGRHRR